MRLGFVRRSPTRLLISIIVLIGLVSACQSEPDTEYLLEVTREVTRIVVVTAPPAEETPVAAVATTQTDTIETETVETTVEPTPIEDLTPVTNPIPTPVTEQIIVAEQVFENGRMFYLEPTGEIWVMIDDNNEWIIFDDDFEEGMPELDPTLIIPDGLFQPIRGFGKLWRENPDVREAIGWAISTEYGHVTTYTYSFDGTINEDGEFVQTSISHTINSYFGGAFLFESPAGTWRRAPDTDQ